MKVKNTIVKVDVARSILKKSISLIEIEDIEKFIKARENSLGTCGINLVENEIRDRVFHKITVYQSNLDPLGKVERTITYEWKD